MNTQLLVPAAGSGTRLGCAGPKALVDLGGKPMLVRTLERFQTLGLTDAALVLAPPEYVAGFTSALKKTFPTVRVIPGGAERQDSVRAGLDAIDPSTEIVVIHDAARPFVPPAAVQASIEAAAAVGAATVAIPAVDTILKEDGDGFLDSTPERRYLWACQTPQTFRVEIIRDAHRRAIAKNIFVTDDATLARRFGARVKLVNGSPLNFKVTTPADLELARLLLREGIPCSV